MDIVVTPTDSLIIANRAGTGDTDALNYIARRLRSRDKATRDAGDALASALDALYAARIVRRRNGGPLRETLAKRADAACSRLEALGFLSISEGLRTAVDSF